MELRRKQAGHWGRWRVAIRLHAVAATFPEVIGRPQLQAVADREGAGAKDVF
jgi:hypothetical protein